jgi:hypothetical protein
LQAFVVVVDIEDAFGSVLHSKLLDILKQLSKLLPKQLFLHRVTVQKAGR